MIHPSSPAAFAALVAGVTVLPIAVGFGLVRAVRRRARWDDRRDARRLGSLLDGFVAGRVAAAHLSRSVQDCPETVLWSALETRLAATPRAARRRIGAALEHNRHSARERRLLLTDSPLRRELAAQRLGLLPSRASRRALRSAAAAGGGLVAFAALRALARQGDGRTLEWLLEQPEPLLRRTHAERVALLRSFGRGAAPRLTDALDRGIADSRLLRAVIEALGAQSHRTAAPSFARALAHAETDVRVAAARALGRAAAAPCSDALLRALADREWPVRAQAAWALGRIGEAAAAPALGACLGDRAWWVRRHAAYALCRLGERGRAALHTAAASSPDRYAREMAAEALEDAERNERAAAQRSA